MKKVQRANFYGSSRYNDASCWITWLDNLRLYCEARGFTLIVQVICPQNSQTDVVLLAKYLHRFLIPYDRDVQPVPYTGFWKHDPVLGRIPSLGYCMQHGHESGVFRFNIDNRSFGQERDKTQDSLLLPAIHLIEHCTVSVSAVLNHIECFFYNNVPESNIFFITGHLPFLINLRLNDKKSFVNASELIDRSCLQDKQHVSNKRILCEVLQEEMTDMVAERIQCILREEKIARTMALRRDTIPVSKKGMLSAMFRYFSCAYPVYPLEEVDPGGHRVLQNLING